MNPVYINDGGPAFGHAAENGHCCGMTLRDWFAGQALVAIVNHVGPIEEIFNGIRAGGNEAQVAFTLADAMLAARDKG